MEQGDRDERARRRDEVLVGLACVLGFLWIPIVLAIPCAIATHVVSWGVYGVSYYHASLDNSGSYPVLDLASGIAALLAVANLLIFPLMLVAVPIVLVLRLCQRRDGFKTPAWFWLLLLGPLLACPIAYAGSMLFLLTN